MVSDPDKDCVVSDAHAKGCVVSDPDKDCMVSDPHAKGCFESASEPNPSSVGSPLSGRSARGLH